MGICTKITANLLGMKKINHLLLLNILALKISKNINKNIHVFY